jgi:hypothetical protein
VEVVVVEAVTTARVQRVVTPGGERTWTVLAADHRRVEPVEEFLEYLRVRGQSPNTVKAYARGLALWWQFLELAGREWSAVGLEDFGRFLGRLRTGDTPVLASIVARAARFSERTIAFAAAGGERVLSLSALQRRWDRRGAV